MKHQVLLSIIIPTYNRSFRLPELLQSLAEQKIDKFQSELIIIDDGSTDSTWILLQSLVQKREDSWLKVLTQKNQGQAAARQYGVQESKGDYLLFLDDDMEPTHLEVLDEHLNYHHKASTPSVVLGAICPPPGSKSRPAFEYFYERSIYMLYRGFTTGQLKPGGAHLFSAHVSMPKALFLQAGGFNADYRHAEDRELGLRLEYDWGVPFVFLPKAAAYHHSPTGHYQAFLNRARLYGHYDLLMSRIHTDHPEIHPAQQLHTQNRIKRWLAHVTWIMPRQLFVLSHILVPLACLLQMIGLRSLAIATCSALYCIHYICGYRQSLQQNTERMHARDTPYGAA